MKDGNERETGSPTATDGARIADHPLENRLINVKTRLVIRESTGPAPADR